MRELTEQEQVRRNKLEEIRKVCNPYPEKFERTHTISEARELEDGTKGVKVAGRIAFARKMGKLSFVRIRNLEDGIQVQFKVDTLGEE
jgi:lysyl-tRNA synthetase class 2